MDEDYLDWTLRRLKERPQDFTVARVQDPSGETPDTYWSVATYIDDQELGRNLWLAQKQERDQALRKRSRLRRATWRRASASAAS